MRSMIPATLLIVALAGAGCTAAVASDPYGPDLVYVSPGVHVIADYHEPVFYSDGLYWRYYGGSWYRSRYYTGGWSYAHPPAAILRVDRPYGYVRYRPQGWVARPRGGYAPAQPARPGGYGGGWRGAPPAQARPAPMRTPPAYHGPARPAPQRRPPPTGGGWR
jgi:hypothetical protein